VKLCRNILSLSSDGSTFVKKKAGKFLSHYSMPKVTKAILSPGDIKFVILNIAL